MTSSIEYRHTGDKRHPIACFTGDPLPRAEQRVLLEREALRLLSLMRADILTDPTSWNGIEPVSYRRFSALMFLAAEDDPARCPADYRIQWIKKDGAPDGTEPEPGFYGRFPLIWQGITLRITYQPDSFYLHDHLEIKSLAAQALLPITATGYRSHFLPRAQLIEAGGVSAFVNAWLDAEDTPEYRERRAVSKQLALF